MASVNPFVAETTFNVRYAETDMMGIVHHSCYIVYFEEARSAYSRQRGRPYSEFQHLGYYLTVTEVNVRYAKPAVYDQQITVRVWIAEMKSRGMTFQYEVVDTKTGETLVTGYTKHVCITHDGKVAVLPALWREWGTS